jgi:hypothetical protein
MTVHSVKDSTRVISTEDHVNHQQLVRNGAATMAKNFHRSGPEFSPIVIVVCGRTLCLR